MGRFRKTVYNLLNRTLQPLGLELHPTWRLPQLEQVAYMRRVFSEWKVSGVIDAGANAGQFASFIRSEIGFHGPILSIEPVPSLAMALSHRSNNHWRVAQAAVGSAVGTGTIQIASGSEFSSMLTPIAATQSLFSGQNRILQTAAVTIETLDSLLDTHGEWLGNRLYLKLDTQGYDLQALEGLSRHFDLVVAAQCEASFVQLYEGAPLIGETVERFQQRGFTLSNLFPNNGGHFPRLIEVDCFFVKDRP